MVLATGASRSAPKIPGIREFDGMGVSYCAVCDGFFCRGRDVAVLGAGAYALHEAQVLLPLAASVTLLPQGQEPELPLPEGLRVDSRPIGALEGTDGILSRVRFEDGETFPVDRVFVALGTAGSGDLARKLGIVLRDRHVAVQPDLSTNIPGLFAAGDCIGGLLQVAKAAADGARAGLSCLKYLRDNR